MNGQRTVVYGVGKTGRSCIQHLLGKCELIVTDSRLDDDSFQLPDEVHRFSHANRAIELVKPSRLLEYVDSRTRLIVSPSVPLSSCTVQACLAAGCMLSSDIDLFLSAYQGSVIGVTGTNGKSTVVSLVTKMLESVGFLAAGNIGKPVLELLEANPIGVALELSSFQLERMQAHHFDAVALLNVTEDHLDHHQDFTAYKVAKHRIVRNSDLAVFNAHDKHTQPVNCNLSIGVGRDENWRVDSDCVVVNGQRILRRDINLKGDHNCFDFVVAAALANHMGASHSDIVKVAHSFEGLAHRTKQVAIVDCVEYINDSKATNVGATQAALSALGTELDPNVILIAGGIGKEAQFEALLPQLEKHAKHVLLFGRDAARMDTVFRKTVVCELVKDLETAVERATQIARTNDVVLFSPACASFDQFQNFEERGEAFEVAVKRLTA